MLIVQENSEKLNEIIAKLERADDIVVDLETTGLHPYEGDRLIGIALYLPTEDESFYLSYRHSDTANLPLESLQRLYSALSDPTKHYWGWNVKFDAHFLLVDGFPILENGAIYRDVMIALHMLDENRYDLSDTRHLNYKLKDNARIYLGADSASDDSELDDLLKSKGYGKGDLYKLKADQVSSYAESDVKLTWELLTFFKPHLEEWQELDLFNEMCEFNGGILLRMEHVGVPVDQALIREHMAKNVIESNKALYSLKGRYSDTFNPNSPTQIKEALGTKDGKRITLERQGSIEAQEIIDYKYLTKANGTFYEPYLKRSRLDGRIHPSFNTTRTNSGRLSSSDPNLQQVPRFSEQYRVKQVFVAPVGYKIVQFDYSQQELRLACHFSGQENMTKEYVEKGEDADVHSLTTSILFGISYEDAKKKENKPKRNIGKVTNFGFSYGMGILKASVYIASSLKKTLYIDKAFYDEYHDYLPKNAKNERLTYEEFRQRFAKYYAGAVEVEDAKLAAKEDSESSISIWETTKILFDWKKLYSRFVDSLKLFAELANTPRTPRGNRTSSEEGYKYMRLDDGRVRHYIKGQRPFTGWNYKIQGTGAMIMRKALMTVNKEFPYTGYSDQVYPIISVHDSMIALIKYDAYFNLHIKEIKRIMEDFPEYYPPMLVDVEYGNNWGELEKWHENGS